jgi:hypothetical protein
MKSRIRQTTFKQFNWGGKRRGAGRKSKGERAGVSHAKRPEIDPRCPLHVTLKLVPGVTTMRSWDELDLLQPYASEKYFKAIRQADRHNVATLKRLENLLASGSRKQIRTFRDSVRKEYRDMKKIQLDAWSRYQHELMAKRDSMLASHFGEPAAVVKMTRPYEAGEFLAENLDERFSARIMAAFLVRHLDRKSEEAKKLAKNRDVEEMTAALYNGGSHNVKRMLAGLIRSLPETQRYMKKVPATRKRLDIAAASVAPPVLESR